MLEPKTIPQAVTNADPPANAQGVPDPLTTRLDDPFEQRLLPLWRLAHGGDNLAYRQALALIAPRVRAYLRRRLGSRPDDLEDLVQETLLALHLKRATWDPDQAVGGWVLAIARHKLIDTWRRQGRQEALHDAIDDLPEHLLPAPQAEAAGSRLDLSKLLGQLPEAQRRAIMLTKLEGLSVAEAAERCGATVAAVKVQVHRGLKRLADLVKPA